MIFDISNRKLPRKEILFEIAKSLDVDIWELFVSTKERDLSNPIDALREIKRIDKI